jgi:uncharacterized protein with von Willebrand factor type A (vWA) domain
MTLLDRAKSFFKRRPELTDATIKRTRIDESIARDMRRKARVLDEAFSTAPTVARDEIHAAPFEGWEGLLTDAYCAHVGLNEPTLTPEDEIKPSAEFARRTMASYVRSEAFGEARTSTRDDPIASAFATVEAARVLRESIEDGELQEHATRAAEMEAVEQSIEELVNELEAAQAQGDDAPDVQGMVDQAQADLERLVDEQEESNLRGAVATVAKRAAEAGEKRAEVASRLPGNQPGSGLSVSPDEAFELAERWTGVEEMWALAMQLGRTKTSMSADRATREVGGHEELVGLERGDDLTRTIPSELMRFRDPRTRRLFMVDWLEGDLLQHATVGHLPRDRGPIIAVRDGSESMTWPRRMFATSVALALVYIAHEERRDSAVVEFGSKGQVKTWLFPAREPISAMTLVECAEHFFNGGTSIGGGMAMAKTIMEDAATRSSFEQADIALLTDGEDHWTPADEAIRDALRAMGVRIFGVQIAHKSEYLAQMCDAVESIDGQALRQPKNAASTFLAQSIS